MTVRESTIQGAGEGSFSTFKAKCGDVLGYLCHKPGDTRNCKFVKKGQGQQNNYTIDVPDGWFAPLGSKCAATFKINTTPAAIIPRKSSMNKKRKSLAKTINVIFVLNASNVLLVFACRNIKAGEELFADYGKAYWTNRTEEKPGVIPWNRHCDKRARQHAAGYKKLLTGGFLS